MRVGYFADGNHFAAQCAETVTAFGFHRRAVVAVFRQAELVDDHITGYVLEGLFGADAAGVFANHHTQRRAWLQAFAAWHDYRLAVAVTGVGGLDEQHRLERWLLIGRLIELGQTALQQALVVQGNAEQAACGDFAGGATHASLLDQAGQSPVDSGDDALWEGQSPGNC
ncbi:hypothetical protein D3C76_964760 [compost metagenome]